jgi:hypothetical protein
MKIFTYVRTLWHEFWNRQPDRLLIENPTQKPEANSFVAPWPEMNERMSGWSTPKCYFGHMVKSNKKLWVYNVSRVSHKVDHPMLGDVTIPANTTRKRYSMWTSFPEYVMETNYNINTDEMYTYSIAGEYFVNDLINPDCVLHCETVVGRTAIGRDLSVRGIFWSYNNPPKPAEVNAAVESMETFYTNLLQKIAISYEACLITEKSVEQEMKECNINAAQAVHNLRNSSIASEVTPEHHAAAEYFKVTTPWHPVVRG